MQTDGNVTAGNIYKKKIDWTIGHIFPVAVTNRMLSMSLRTALVSSFLCLFAVSANARPAKPSTPAKAPLTAPAETPPAAAVATPAAPNGAPLALETLRVLAWSQADGRAVLGFPDQKMEVVKTGEAIPRTNAVLTEVLPDKLVLHDKVSPNKPLQLVWMSKGQGAARVQRFATDSGSSAALSMPAAHAAVPGGEPAKPARPQP
ncbi:MAG TPA: hypothetical protein VFS95_06740 [Telluria sp.]|nr:hypothetical protein [Telluria sp.]